MKPDLFLKTVQPRCIWIPYIVLVAALLLTALTTYCVAKTAEVNDRIRFQDAVDRTKENIRDRLEPYLVLLHAGSKFLEHNEGMSRDDLRAFVNQIKLRQRYPGIQEISFGFDAFPPTHHAAMERARDTGMATASGRILLEQKLNKHLSAGFSIYVPIYRKNSAPKTVSERRAALKGFVYSPFLAQEFFEDITETEQNQYVDCQVYDGIQLKPENLLHRANHQNMARSRSLPRFSATTTIDVAGRTWSINVTSNQNFDRLSQTGLVPYISLGGLLLSFILFCVARSHILASEALKRSTDTAYFSEEALYESEERFQKLAQKVRVIPWKADATRKFTYVGAQAVKILGYGLSDWYTDNFWHQHIHPKDHESAVKYCRDCSALENYEFEYRMLTADGNTIWLHDIVNVFREQDGSQSLRGMMIDITERKRTEEERKQLLVREQAARAEVEIANRIKDEFLGTVSHELRTPLNAIQGWMQLMRTRKFDEITTNRALETINRNAKALLQLIENVLDVSRIVAGNLRLNANPIELKPVIFAAIETVLPAAEAKDIELRFAVLDEQGVEDTKATASERDDVFKSNQAPKFLVLGDESRLQQIMWNLLSNAVKFTPVGGRTDIHLSVVASHTYGIGNSEELNHLAPTAYAQIQVTDTGVGINPDFLPYVFDRFRQADSSVTRSYSGLGLGLAIVRHLVELHGGTVHAQSQGAGKGATFTLRLPLFHKSRELGVASSGLAYSPLSLRSPQWLITTRRE